MSGGDTCYYSVLGLCNKASPTEIREAYRKQALKWHPDRWMKDPILAGQAKRRFQQIHEAYSVLSNEGKKKIYDAAMLGLLEDDDDEGFCDFMQEMILLMENVGPQGNTMEDLQKLLVEMMGNGHEMQGDNFGTTDFRNVNCDASSSYRPKRKRFS